VSVDFQKYVLIKNILNNILILDTSIKTIKKKLKRHQINYFHAKKQFKKFIIRFQLKIVLLSNIHVRFSNK
jgi:hypothetical protein